MAIEKGTHSAAPAGGYKSEVFDRVIAPLVDQIMTACEEANISVHVGFHLDGKDRVVSHALAGAYLPGQSDTPDPAAKDKDWVTSRDAFASDYGYPVLKSRYARLKAAYERDTGKPFDEDREE